MKLYLLAFLTLLSTNTSVHAQVKSAAAGQISVIYILDGSNSMWGQVDGKSKIEIAKSVLSDLVANTDSGERIGLVAYGHRDKESCTDIELLRPVGSEPGGIVTAIAAITPMGKTPISGALDVAASSFADAAGQNNIVLISDGVETCDADPCATAKALAEKGVNTRVHVVGFDVNDAEKQALECIASAGNGQYFQASNADTFKTALKEVQVAAVQATPEPAPASSSQQVFFDDFDGDELADHWEVSNPDPESFVVEDGSLFTLNNHVGGVSAENGKNIITVAEAMPKSDFDAIAKFTGELTTGSDRVEFGLWKDDQNFLVARLWAVSASHGCNNIALALVKRVKGEETIFQIPLRGKIGCGGPDEVSYGEVKSMIEESGVTLTLSKRGRKYSASLQLGEEVDEAGQSVTYETDTLSSLRSPGKLSFAIGKIKENAPGEILVLLDSVEVISYPAE